MLELRSCLQCRRPLHPKAAPTARYCGGACRTRSARARQKQDLPLSEFARQLEAKLLSCAAPQVQAYALGHQAHRGACTYRFPNPVRRSPRADGALRKSQCFSLRPFEPPVVPMAGLYQVLFFDSYGRQLETPKELGGGLWISEASAWVSLLDGQRIP